MSIETQKYTAQEFSNLNLPDDKQYELVEGEIVEMSPAGRRHSRISLKIASRLLAFVEQHNLGEVYPGDVGITLSPQTVRSPDVSFIAAARLEGLPEDAYLPIAPDLAVEVISPTDVLKDVKNKALEYLRAGVQVVWVINPRKKTAEVYKQGSETPTVLGIDDRLESEAILEGFQLPLKELFG